MITTLAPTQTMTADQAAWVREHVFTAEMRAEFRWAPRRYMSCVCLQPAFVVCERGGHERCPRTNGIAPETYLYRPSELVRPASGTRTIVNPVQVWRVGRPCRHRCGCDCHSGKSRKASTKAALTAPVAPKTWSPLPAKAGKGQQLSFF